jgi:hypothetical protein
LTAIGTADPAQPFLPFFHPPIELASARPRSRLHLDGRVDITAIYCRQALHLVVAEIHN